MIRFFSFFLPALLLTLGGCSSQGTPEPTTRTYDARWQGITALPCGANKQDVAGLPLSEVLQSASSVTLYPEQQTPMPAPLPHEVVLIVAEPAMARYHPLLRDALNQDNVVADSTYCVYDPAAVFEAAGLPKNTQKSQTLALDDQGNVIANVKS
jgi:hypothetical protein